MSIQKQMLGAHPFYYQNPDHNSSVASTDYSSFTARQFGSNRGRSSSKSKRSASREGGTHQRKKHSKKPAIRCNPTKGKINQNSVMPKGEKETERLNTELSWLETEFKRHTE